MSGFKGYEMRFPIIKIKDKGNQNHIHIVGTDSHDTLYIDNDLGGIHYYNLQNGDGTRGDYEFVGDGSERDSNLQIDFVSIDELIEIYKTEMQLTIETENAIKLLVKTMRKKKEEVEDSGIFHT